jgi:protocatechuate 3,4-dioxygenase beta subunit
MSRSGPSGVSRRGFLSAVTTATVPFLLLARVRFAFGRTEEKGVAEMEPTPAIGDDDVELTPEETAGPFFRPNSPAKMDFREPGVTGVPVNLSGCVLDQKGKPVAGALLDFWHADADGHYDFDGFRCRGHQFADTSGRYLLQTIMPCLYPSRTRHYHVRMQAAHGPILTTQLYFPGEPRNSEDFLFRRDLLLTIRGTKTGWDATFNFVLRTS